MADDKGPIPYLDVINAGLGQVLVGLPVVLAAYRLLYGMFKQVEPGLTFEEYNARLMTTATEVTDFSRNWLEAAGYTKQSDGSWIKPSPTPAA